MCCCFACAATVVGVLAAYVVLSILCLHLSYAAPAATIVALSAVVIACGVALRYAAALVSTHVLGMLLQGILLHVLLLHKLWPLHLMLPSCAHASFAGAPATFVALDVIVVACFVYYTTRTVVAHVTY